MVGYSNKSLIAKLGIKESVRLTLLKAPPGFSRTLGTLPAGVEVVGPRGRGIDVAILFVTRAKNLVAEFPKVAARIKPNGMIWIAWPKKSAKAPTDLSENPVRDIGLETGLVDVKVCAIDDYWSGLKFVRRLKDR